MLTIADAEMTRMSGKYSTKCERTDETIIFRLPGELIDAIIKNATANWGRVLCSCSENEPTWDNATAKSLSLVCQRFKNIAQPLLYRNISFPWPIAIAPPSDLVIKLHRTFSHSPALRKHTRVLSLYIPDLPPSQGTDKYSILKDFATWLTRVHCLSIRGGFKGGAQSQHTWGIIRTISETMKEMAHIRLFRGDRGLFLNHAMANLSYCLQLKRLSLNGVSEWEDKRTVHDHLKRQRTSPIESLSLSDYEECPQFTAALLLWPRELTHFKFASLYTSPHTMDYPMFETWLGVHRDTLKSIDIGCLANIGSTRLFNATLFPNLESLKLSRWQRRRMVSAEEPLRFTADDANVLGAKVKFFGWDFDSHFFNEPWGAFGEDDVDWVTTLAQTAIAQAAPLKIIRIFSTPHIEGGNELDGHLLERLDRVRDLICKPNGMELRYTEPLSRSS